ncbi:MAG: transcriptional regulator PpsR [Hydrogenophaga sp.]|nr:transcriptional regulator PpsR [Hydrogenophaga sp.]
MPQAPEAPTERPLAFPGQYLGDLDADAVGELLTTSADILLVLDGQGVIRDVACHGDPTLVAACEQWVGRPWVQTVTPESRAKVEALLEGRGEPSRDGVRWRHVNHQQSDAGDLPMSYAVAPLQRTGRGRGAASLVAFGRDLRNQVALQQRLVTAQLSMERDYWRLRQVETRYRLLFQMASEPVVILEGAIDKLEEANPAAQELFGEAMRSPHWTLSDGLDQRSQVALREMIERLRVSGRADPILVRLRDGDQELEVTASQFRQENTQHFLLRFGRNQASVRALNPASQQLLQVFESAPDAIVLADVDGRIQSVNRSFLDLTQLATEDQARGESLDKWLGRTGVDFRVLLTNLRQHGTVRLFNTQLRGEYGATAEVEVSAVAVQNGPQRQLGFTIRDMGRRLMADARGTKELPRSASQMTELVGRLPLKDIVRETTDLIEQLCIEAALELTGDNRASAAEMLGLSRQSLYIKLRRFGILEGVQDEAQP